MLALMIILLLVFIFAGIYSCYFINGTQNGIPTPKGLPILGGISEFLSVFGPAAHKVLMSRFWQFGPIYQFGVLKSKMVFLFTLKDLIKLKKAEGFYPVHLDFKHLRRYRTSRDLPLGLLVSTGEDWLRQRKHIGKALLSSSSLKCYFEGVDMVAKKVAEDLSESASESRPIEMESIVGHYVLLAMARVMMGYEGDEQEEQTVHDFTSIITTARENFKDARILLSTPTFLWPFVKAWRRHSGRWDHLLRTTKRYIENYLSRDSTEVEEISCVLSHLLKSPELTLPEAHINITDLVLASIDTTSSSILWCVYELSLSSKTQHTLFLEIKDFLEAHGTPSFSGLQDLPYLKAVLKESQRLHPVGFFVSRILQESSTIQGYHIDTGSHVAGSMYVIGRDSSLFPQPDVFNPDRWLEDNSDLETFTNNVPFGLGRRMCIGRRVAEIVMSCFIFHLVKSYRIETVSDEPVEPTFRLLMVPGQPVIIRLKSR
ncbi:hypothetical protein SNE40_001030 [Patella caerulea]|uniref:Cytochrome P450 n=1 Tax=Patella caerulea TaxID=87958 RepID=A0AAN8KD79_PATCE